MATQTINITTNDWPPGLVGDIGYTVKDASNVTKIARATAGVTQLGQNSYQASFSANTAWGPLTVIWDSAAGDTATEDIANAASGAAQFAGNHGRFLTQ